MKLSITKPTITSHHFYALPLAIIGSDTRLKLWIYNEFIQMFTCRNREDEIIDIRLYNKDNEMFKYEPLYDTIISPNRLVYGERVIEVYKSLLESEQYIYDFVDKNYILSFGFGRHFIHDLLVYGYDDEKEVFYAYAYNGGKLKEFEIPYKEYIEAYNSEYMQTRFHITVLYRKKKVNHRIDVKKIGTYLLDYLEGIDSYSRESLHKVNLYKPKFGIHVYEELKGMITHKREQYMNIDIPNVYCFYDHKRLMLERILYLDENTNLICPDTLKEKFKDVKQAGNIIAMLSLKLNQKRLNSKSDFDALMKRIDLLKEMEEAALSEYYEYNSHVFENA